MNRFFVIIFYLFIVGVYAQVSTINWNGFKEYDYGSKILKLPNAENSKVSYNLNTVFLHYEFPANENNILIKNLVWEKSNSNELYDLNQTLLPDYDIADVSYNNKKSTRLANVAIATFKKQNNSIYRLKSFEVENTQRQNPSFNKVGSTENPLASGKFYKIKVDKSGVFRITSQFLQTIGINPATVNPKHLRIYGNGGIMLPEHNQDTKYDALQENAIQVFGEEDGVWNTDDYAVFYAQGPHGYNLYDQSNGNGYKRRETRLDRCNNLINIYDDFSYYFITFDKGTGKRVQTEDTPISTSEIITRYDAFQFINNDQKNLLKLGKVWVESPGFTSPKNINFTIGSALLPNETISYRARVIAEKAANNSIQFTINNLNPFTQNVPNIEIFPILYSGIISNVNSTSINFSITPNISSNPNGTFYIDYVEIQYKENLSFNGSQLSFRDFSIVSGSNKNYAFSISNASNLEQVWDVTDITNAKRKVNKASGNTLFNFGYIASDPNFNNEFVAFRASAAFDPIFVGAVENQNLKALQNIDYLVVTTPEMMPQAQRLANYHQTKNGFSTAIVDVNKIYNEYSSGRKDITAIRDFVTHLNTPAGSLKYLFILGDATYDFKNRIANNNNIVPSYQSEESGNYITSFVTDDYYVMTEPQTSSVISSNLPDLPVGRIPAANVQEAKEMIDKILAYYNFLPSQSNPFGTWRMKLHFVVDDDKDGGEPFHNIVNKTLVDIFETPTTTIPEYNVRKLYLDAFPAVNTAGGQRFPQVNQALSNDIGYSNYLFYFGHGGISSWAQERVLTLDEINNFNNFTNVFSRFPFVSTITCEFTLWDDPDTFSAGERFIKLKNGGTTTMITSSRAISVFYGIFFGDTFKKSVFELSGDDFQSLGNAFLKAKINFGFPQLDHLKINFLGDPAMTLARPKKQLVIDNIISPVPGQLRALDFVKITGHINKPDGTINTNFNGKAEINIFDKRLNKTTLNNDGNMTPVLQYTEEGSPIVKATGNVVNGLFTVEFYMPNDINFTLGQGRILAYADNKQEDVFQNVPYLIGGINPNGINDNQPPKVKLYMNNTNFADGGITNQNPILLACITDDTGINSTGAGIGHDITTYLDGQIINTIVLNDFYSPGDGNGCLNPDLAEYQKGNLMYPFRNLAPGEHTLTFKVWDINNNSTTESLRFIVKDESEEKLIINRPMNWPNPFTDKTYIHFEHNCDDILDVNVQIYTITGKLVKTISQAVIAEPFLQGFRTPKYAIEWDGTDDYGDTVGKGTYIFKIFARSQNQEKCKGGATAIEKMVLLK